MLLPHSLTTYPQCDLNQDKNVLYKTILLISALTATVPLAVLAQAWPNKPVKIIVVTPPGLPPDVLARGMAQQLEAKYGQPFLIENRPGANTIVGVQACAAAQPDGYTLCITLNDSVSLNPDTVVETWLYLAKLGD